MQGGTHSGLFAVDLRSLALFRVGLALILLVNLAMRWPHVAMLLTDQGVMPRDLRHAIAVKMEVPCLPPSVFALTGSEAGVKCLFVLTGFFALALLVGYRTRVASIGCWILMVGLHSRNPLILDGGDSLLLLLVFWAMFVPLGAVASLDARAGRGPPPGVTSVTSMGTKGLLLQAAFLYIFAGIEKWGDEWEPGGRALCHMFRMDLFTRPPGRLLLPLHPWLHMLPPLVTWGELAGGFLLFFPIETAKVRLLLIAGFAALQASFLICVHVVLFPFVSILATIPFLPSIFWDRILGASKEEGSALGDANRIERGLAAAALTLVILVNISWIAYLPFKLPPALDQFIQTVALHQHWNMFSPSPPTMDGWPVLEATLDDGRVLDLFTGEAPTREKPAVVIDRFRTFRESMIFFKLILNDWTRPMGHEYLRFRVAEWEAQHPEGPRIRSARLVMMYEPTLLDCREGIPRPWLLGRVGEGKDGDDLQEPPGLQPESRQGNPR